MILDFVNENQTKPKIYVYGMRDLLLLLFLCTEILTICGLVYFWNPNLLTLSQVYGNYNNKIYFFFLVNLFGMICALAYEYTFKDIISFHLFLILAITYVLLLWISEDVQDTLRFKSHVILSAISLLFSVLYILYHAVRKRDLLLYVFFFLSLTLFYSIVSKTTYAFRNGLSVTEILLEEVTMLLLCVLTVVRRG
jgi:hypothetical protein